MPRRGTGRYPDNWREIATAVKAEAGWRCVRCLHPHDPAAGRTLTVHHLNMDKGDCRWWNIVALCQSCHLSVQARVNLDRVWVMAPHSPWFKPYVAGYYASRYLGIEYTREEIERALPDFLALERIAILGSDSLDGRPMCGTHRRADRGDGPLYQHPVANIGGVAACPNCGYVLDPRGR